jgi:ABC-type glycerol-3-phosphate transport system substrate-binding protein
MTCSQVFRLVAAAVFIFGSTTSATGRPKDEQAIAERSIDNGILLAETPITVEFFWPKHKTKPFTESDLTIITLQERANVHFKCISISSDYWDKYIIMLASGDLPDLIFTTLTDAIRYSMDGLFSPLDEMFEKHATNILEAIPVEGTEADMRVLDGRHNLK